MKTANQASEDELLKQINRCFVPHEDHSWPCVGCKTTRDNLYSLIRTEKLKLLAGVRERAVGDDDLVDAEILKKLYDKAYSNGYNDRGYENSYNSQDYRSAEDIAPIIAKIRGGHEKRLSNLAKLEAEL